MGQTGFPELKTNAPNCAGKTKMRPLRATRLKTHDIVCAGAGNCQPKRANLTLIPKLPVHQLGFIIAAEDKF